jgi:hypothetical protein
MFFLNTRHKPTIELTVETEYKYVWLWSTVHLKNPIVVQVDRNIPALNETRRFTRAAIGTLLKSEEIGPHSHNQVPYPFTAGRYLYVPPALTFNNSRILPIERIYLLRMVLRINSDSVPKQH